MPLCVRMCVSVRMCPGPKQALASCLGRWEREPSGCAEPSQNHPCQGLGVGKTQEQVVRSVVQMLMFCGHGCVKRGEQRDGRSDLTPRGPRSPTYTQGKHRLRPLQRLLGPMPHPSFAGVESSTGKMPQVCLV